jgi:uncharacterized RmlC-like cupin family protein
MAEQDEILVVSPSDRKLGPSTPGMDRQQAVATDGMWSGVARTEASMVSGWHHHGEYETTIYVLTGALLMEFGPGGSSTVEAGPGDFVYVPKGAPCTGRVILLRSRPTSSWCALAGGSPRSTSTARRKPEGGGGNRRAGRCLRGVSPLPAAPLPKNATWPASAPAA